MSRVFFLIVLLFFSSGATALVYEVVWSKYLGLIFGSTVQAQAMVLAIFMGGLAIGNRLFGKFADRLASPIALYGWIEIAIGVYGLLFHQIYLAADGVFARAGAGLLHSPQLLLILKTTLSLALLLGPTILMGGTLPLMAAWLQRHSAEAGRRTALFYAVNSLGAMTGAGLAGFVLVPWIGLLWTLSGTGVANLIIGGIALGVAASVRRREGVGDGAVVASRTEADDPAPEGIDDPERRRFLGLACVLVAIVGGISMALEVLAARALAMVFGASLQAFSTMLMAFILGIGLGSMAIASPWMNRFIRKETIVVLLTAGAGAIALFLLTIEPWAATYVTLRNRLGAEGSGYVWHLVLTSGISIAVLGVPAALLGAVLPLSIRLAGGGNNALGNRVGRLLTWNTLGAVAGVLLAGFVAMPLFGLHTSLVLLSVLLCFLALYLGLELRLAPKLAAGGVLAFGVAAAFLSVEPWQRVVNSGIFRWRDAEGSAWEQMRAEHENARMVFYKDGADATVAVKETPLVQGGTQLMLTINGKPDATSHADLSTQYLLAHLPMAAKPDSRDVFVLGVGSGITAGVFLEHPVERIVVAENCRPVLEAARLFGEWNRGVLTDERTEVFYEDARTVLKLSPDQYDIIVSEPSNPWSAGIGNVFSRDFFEIAAGRLNPGGIMAQWFHMYETEDDVVFMVLRTFNSVFPYMEVWETQIGDIVLLGSKEPWESGPAKYRELFERPGPRDDLRRIGLETPEAFWARQLASQESAYAIAGPGPITTDARPILEFEAVRAFYRTQGSFGLFSFDERTVQSGFAPEEKRRVLAALPDRLLGPAFGYYPSGNPALMAYYRWRVGDMFGRDGRMIYFEQPFMPIIFRPPESFSRHPPPAEGLGETMREMLRAATRIAGRFEDWAEGARTIEGLLRDAPENNLSDDERHWLVHFAAMAAKARFLSGDEEGARDSLRRVAEIDPENVQLAYMKRIFAGR